MLELGMTWSYEQLILDNEFAGMVKRVIQGIQVTDETLAVELIKKVGAGGDFLAQKHTRAYMSAEQSKVELIDRRMRGTWEKRGARDIVELAGEKARYILENHKCMPLEPGVASEIRAIIEEREEEAKAS